MQSPDVLVTALLEDIQQVPYMGIFGGGKLWRTVQVKDIGEEKFGE